MGEGLVAVGDAHHDVVAGLSEEGGAADAGIEGLHGAKGAEVEALKDDAGLEMVALDRLVDEGDEGLGAGGHLGVVDEDLGLDVEAEVALGGEVEDLFKGRDGGVGHGNLVGEAGDGVAAVVLLDLSEGERVDRGSGSEGGPVALALVAQDGGDAGIFGGGLGDVGRVGDDEDVVFGDGQVQFEHVDSVMDGVLEGRDGVFGLGGSASAVGVDLDGWVGLIFWERLARCGERAQEKHGRKKLCHWANFGARRLQSGEVLMYFRWNGIVGDEI